MRWLPVLAILAVLVAMPGVAQAQCETTTTTTTTLPCQAFPATGQTTCYGGGGGVIPCAGTGQDGDIRAGATLAYRDNGDGTITDLNTKLQWEKLSDDLSVHDKDTTYTWTDAFAQKLAVLNVNSFAGHNDWRLPNVRELQSIVNYENANPAVSPAFNTGCTFGCTVTTCSCTPASAYWSSTSWVRGSNNAWVVDFLDGGVAPNDKQSISTVRAVRGGSCP